MLHALDRMQQREALQPGQLTDQAHALLLEYFGVGEAEEEAALAHGALGLLSGHTHYFNGFALLMPLPHGVAVAVRQRAEGPTRLTFGGRDDVWTFQEDVEALSSAPVWVRVVQALVRQWAPAPVDVAVANVVPPGCMDAYLAALAMATLRALQSHFALPVDSPDAYHGVQAVLAREADMPYSIAYPIAADQGRPQAFSLVDTETLEHLPVDAPDRDVLGWGLIDARVGHVRKESFHRKRQKQVQQATERLRKKAFPELTTLRELEHRHLEQALGVLPRRLGPVVRHLVTENQRVQKLVAAARNRDWQMFGALLLMSHASLRDEWACTDPRVDFIVEQAEAMSFDGLYGAFASGRSGCALLLGKPFAVPPRLDAIQAAYAERFETPVETLLL
jgi:galactokinase